MRAELVGLIEFTRKLYQSSDFIPLHEPLFIGREKTLVQKCIDSTFVSSVGEFVYTFEQQLTQYTGAKYAVASVSGTSALHIALLLASVERDTEVITQPLSFIATCNAIKYCGAVPVFIDVDKNNMSLSPKALREFLEAYGDLRDGNCYNSKTNKRLSACVPMNTFGHSCKSDEIKSICDQWNIPMIEDAAESLGSFYKGKHTGTTALLAAISFNGNKIITAGGGGAIITNNEFLAKKAKHLTTTAKVPHKWEFNHDMIGYNYRMPNINAALLCSQFEQLGNFLENKRETANKYKEFCNNNKIDFISEPLEASSNYWLNAILLENLQERNDFLDFSNSQGVMTRPAWTLLNKLPMFEDCFAMPLPNSEWLANRLVNIPSSVRI